jgi:glucan phosphorylase
MTENRPAGSVTMDMLPTSIIALRTSIERHARYTLAQSWEDLSPRQIFECVSLAVRDLIVDRRLDQR